MSKRLDQSLARVALLFAALGDETRLTLLNRLSHGGPASITVLSGDVHHAYLSEVAYPRSAGVESSVWQAVCSPFRNALDDRERKVIAAGNSRFGELVGAAARPIDDVRGTAAYRRHALRVLAQRALERCVA